MAKLFRNIDISEYLLGNIEKTISWLQSTPSVSVFRPLKGYDANNILYVLRKELPDYESKLHDTFKDVAVLLHKPQLIETLTNKNYVLIDQLCAAAVLRGSDIFAPGVIGMSQTSKLNSTVQIYVDLKNEKYLKGDTLSNFNIHNNLLIGHGLVLQQRPQVFTSTGIAVQVSSRLSGCPRININNLFPEKTVILQNIPSITAVEVLNPKANETVLDMCAAPGNKTTLIAEKMNYTGKLVAVEVRKARFEILQSNCDPFVECVLADSTNLTFDYKFDKILLDAPCSALGQRPQFYNNIKTKELLSFAKLQRKLIAKARELLKPGGVLVYSTCTLSKLENEDQVDWIENTFNDLEHVKAGPYVTKTHIDQKPFQKFGWENDDCIGFFIAKFIKRNVY